MLDQDKTMRQLSSLREQYEREGYVVVRNVIDAGLVDEGRAHIAWLLEKHPDLRPEQLGHTLVKDDPFWVNGLRATVRINRWVKAFPDRKTPV